MLKKQTVHYYARTQNFMQTFANATRMSAFKVTPTTLATAYFQVAVTYLQFPIQVCFLDLVPKLTF